MREIPVFEIVGRGVWFVAANMITLLRLTWLPLALLLGAQVALGQVLALAADGTSKDQLIDSPMHAFTFLASAALQLIALSAVGVRVHRLVLARDRAAGEFFAFSFGGTELRYAVMAVAAVAFALASLVALANGIVSIGDATGGWSLTLDPRPLTSENVLPFLRSAGLVCLAVAGAVFWIWAVLRLALWPPAVVANRGFALGAALQASRGRVWPLFFLLFIPSQLIGFAAILAAVALGINVFPAIDRIGDGYVLFGGFAQPSVVRFAVLPTPGTLAFEFATMFAVTTYFAAVLSFGYLAAVPDSAPAAADAS